jgi:hypothetical protein
MGEDWAKIAGALTGKCMFLRAFVCAAYKHGESDKMAQ